MLTGLTQIRSLTGVYHYIIIILINLGITSPQSTIFSSSSGKDTNLDPDTLASPPSNSAGRNVGGNNKNNPNHENPIKSDLDKMGRNVDSSIVRQPSGSIRSTNSSISVMSSSIKTNSELSVNPSSKNTEELTNGMYDS